jgi:hypothetical protein
MKDNAPIGSAIAPDRVENVEESGKSDGFDTMTSFPPLILTIIYY